MRTLWLAGLFVVAFLFAVSAEVVLPAAQAGGFSGDSEVILKFKNTPGAITRQCQKGDETLEAIRLNRYGLSSGQGKTVYTGCTTTYAVNDRPFSGPGRPAPTRELEGLCQALPLSGLKKGDYRLP